MKVCNSEYHGNIVMEYMQYQTKLNYSDKGQGSFPLAIAVCSCGLISVNN